MELVINATGLCGLIKTTEGAIKLVLPLEESHFHGGVSERHYAALLVARKLFVDDPAESRKHDFGLDGDFAGLGAADMVGFILDFEVLDISGTTGKVTVDDTPIGECPTEEDQGSIRWLPQMRDFNAGTMNRAAFYATDRKLVAGQLVLRGGSLATKGFARDHKGQVLRWVFKSDAQEHPEKRALGEAVKYHSDLGGHIRKITFQSSRSTRTDQRNITIKEDPDTQVASCWLVNQPIEDMVFNRSETYRGPIEHFPRFFDLAKGSPTALTPFPLGETCPPFHVGATNPRCPLAVFSAHE